MVFRRRWTTTTMPADVEGASVVEGVHVVEGVRVVDPSYAPSKSWTTTTTSAIAPRTSIASPVAGALPWPRFRTDE